MLPVLRSDMHLLAAVTLLVAVQGNRVSGLGSRIVGGVEASIEELPYQVSIRLRGSHYCGGSILDARRVLTAGHCSGNMELMYSVHAGSTFEDSEGSIHRVVRVARHEHYGTTQQGAPVHDIAIFRVSPPFTLSDTEKAISLPGEKQSPQDGTEAIVSGWGRTKENGAVSRRLMKLVVPVLNTDACNASYSHHIPANQLCAGVMAGGKDSCQGDSGGPLVANGVQIGIVSWGAGCAQPNYPGVYTDVAKYRRWIKSKTGL